MSNKESVYHHQIPKTYMKAWCFSNNSIWCYDKETKIKKVRNIEKIIGKRYFHSIRAGSLYTNEEALKKIFKALEGFKISFEGEELLTLDDLNSKFFEFENWTISYPNGNRVANNAKNQIKQRILSTTANSIEEQWSKQMENEWNNVITIISNKLDQIKKHLNVLTVEEAETIMRYFIMFQWRGTEGSQVIDDAISLVCNEILCLSNDEIPENERAYSYDSDITKEIKHAFLLKAYDEFFQQKGVMYDALKQYLNKLTFIFLLAPNDSLISSDKPCFTFINKTKAREPIFVAAPNLIISLALKDPNNLLSYKIHNLSNEEIEYYNQKIYENGNLILSSNEYLLERYII